MNITAVTITTIICITICALAWIGTRNNGKGGKGNER